MACRAAASAYLSKSLKSLSRPLRPCDWRRFPPNSTTAARRSCQSTPSAHSGPHGVTARPRFGQGPAQNVITRTWSCAATGMADPIRRLSGAGSWLPSPNCASGVPPDAVRESRGALGGRLLRRLAVGSLLSHPVTHCQQGPFGRSAQHAVTSVAIQGMS